MTKNKKDEIKEYYSGIARIRRPKDGIYYR